jgi:uncharacterized protein YifN (PemK superfamily)
MALEYHPYVGTIVLCNYNTGFKLPEMVKKRPAVIISPRLRRRDGLCSVVPLSQTAPKEVQEYHYELILERPLPKPWNSPSYWVKADMISTVGFHRLHLIGIGKDHEGKRNYLTSRIPDLDLINIKKCVLNALGMTILTSHL